MRVILMAKKNILKCLILSVLLGLGINCGRDVSVNIDQNTYEPRIVVEGYLFPGLPPSGIRIMRNYGLNMRIDLNEIVIDDAQVVIRDLTAESDYDLVYDAPSFAYRYPGRDFLVQHGGRYRLSVSARIDGSELWTASVTTVPEKGFAIDREASILGPFEYRQRDGEQNLQKVTVQFERSPSTDSYISSIVALDGSLDTFIEDNAFGLERNDLQEYEEILPEIIHQAQWTQTELGGTGNSQFQIEWFSIWFYSRYRVILYAADKNFTDFFLTHRMVQEFDGNLLEPKFHFEGDGIGVFGSAAADTVYFDILP